MISFLPESWFPKKQNFDFHTPDRWWISPRIIQMNILVRWNHTSGNLGIRCPEVEITYVIMRVYSRNALFKPYTSRIDLLCSASMLVMLIQ